MSIWYSLYYGNLYKIDRDNGYYINSQHNNNRKIITLALGVYDIQTLNETLK